MKKIYEILEVLKVSLPYLNVSLDEKERVENNGNHDLSLECVLKYGNETILVFKEYMKVDIVEYTRYYYQTRDRLYERLSFNFIRKLLLDNIYSLMKQAEIDYEKINKEMKEKEMRELEERKRQFDNDVKQKLGL